MTLMLTAAGITGTIILAGSGFWLFAVGFEKFVEATTKPIEAITEFVEKPAGKIVAIGGTAIIGALAIMLFLGKRK